MRRPRPAPVPQAIRETPRRSIPFVGLLAAGSLFVILALSAPPAAAESSWSGSGSFTFTSTPAPGSCTGSGTSDITLDGSGGSATGSMTLYFSYTSPDCSGDLPGAGTSFTAGVTLSISGSSVTGSDPSGDTISGTASSSSLDLALTVGGGSGGGGSCVEYCHTVYQFSYSGSGDLFASDALFGADFSFAAVAALFGGLLGLAGLIGALASFRGPHMPMPGASASIQAPATGGFLSNSPTGGGVATSMPMTVPTPPGTPAAGYPSWGYDFRTTPYTPNPAIMGWTDLLQKFQLSLGGKPPAPPTWPLLREAAPPTSWPGVFCQPRVNPQTGQWAWWNPVDGTFPWG